MHDQQQTSSRSDARGSEANIFRVIRHGDEATGTNYTIYLEHLGGFLPILKGKKTSKLKPEFVIFDPLKGTFHNSKILLIHET